MGEMYIQKKIPGEDIWRVCFTIYSDDTDDQVMRNIAMDLASAIKSNDPECEVCITKNKIGLHSWEIRGEN
jgi:hypothetical protein